MQYSKEVEEMCCVAKGPKHGPAPVSYTHLDVYKRQGELWGVADRTDFDLKQHAQHSGENFEYQDPVDVYKRQLL